jgi:hypothetical protein
MAIRRDSLGAARRSRSAVDSALDDVTRTLTAAWVKAWDELEPEFARTLTDLVSEGSGDRGPSRVRIRKDERLQFAMGRVSRAMRALTTTTRTETTAAIRIAIEVGNTAQSEIIAAQLPKAHRGLVESRRSDLTDVFTRMSRRVAVLTRAIPDYVDATMRRTIARIAMSRLRPDTSQMLLKQTEAAFNLGLARALVIARTEALDAHRQASAIGQAANADVLDGWIWLARLDRDTCSACFVMHGSVHALSEMGPDGHQQCRCQRVPKAKSWKELGIDIGLPEPDDLIPDGQTIFRSMPRDQQLRILGPTRLDLLDRGDIEWGDLATERRTPGWRRSYVPTPVNRLIEG